MSGTHSSTVAEERLFPSAEMHKGTTTEITTTSAKGQQYLDSTVVGNGPGRVEPVGAFEVPRSRRLIQIGVAVTYCLLAAGIVFGYAALKPVLVEEGVYRDRCTKHELEEGVRVCFQQEIRLNFMFTVAAVTTNVCALLVGTVLDRYGPRVSGIIGSFLFASGCVVFAFSKSLYAIFDTYPIAYLLIAIGGPFVFIPSFHLANAFPQRSGLILSMLTGAFDSSSAVFLFYRLGYDYYASEGGISLRSFFLCYLIVPVFIFTAQLTIMPAQSYKTTSELVQQAVVEQDLITNESDFLLPGDEDPLRARLDERTAVVSEIDHLLGGHSALEQREKAVAAKRDHSGVWGAMHNIPVSKQMRSFWFWGIALFTIVQMTRINYFVATIRPQYQSLLGSWTDAVKINAFFDIALPLGGLAAIPFIGVVLDSLSTLTVLSILVTTATTIGTLGIIPHSWPAAYSNILLFVVYRPFYYTVVSDYCAKVFGISTFGKIYGAVICMAGLFNFSQAVLDHVTHKVFRDDPRPVNVGLMGAAVVVGVMLCGYVAGRGREVRRRQLGEEVEACVSRRLWEGEDMSYGGV